MALTGPGGRRPTPPAPATASRGSGRRRRWARRTEKARARKRCASPDRRQTAPPQGPAHSPPRAPAGCAQQADADQRGGVQQHEIGGNREVRVGIMAGARRQRHARRAGKPGEDEERAVNGTARHFHSLCFAYPAQGRRAAAGDGHQNLQVYPAMQQVQMAPRNPFADAAPPDRPLRPCPRVRRARPRAGRHHGAVQFRPAMDDATVLGQGMPMPMATA